MSNTEKNPEVLLEARELRMSYPSGERRIDVLEAINLVVLEGESLSITGESGCGKTTLLNLLAAIERPDSGSLFWQGEEIYASGNTAAVYRKRAAFLGMVFQSYYLVPELDALENVLFAARILGRLGSSEKQRAAELLERAGLGGRMKHLPSQLSGGERQRVAVARALMNRPRIVLADEPTGNLDEATGEGVLTTLLDVCGAERAALVLVTHNKIHAARTSAQANLAHKRLQRV